MVLAPCIAGILNSYKCMAFISVCLFVRDETKIKIGHKDIGPKFILDQKSLDQNNT